MESGEMLTTRRKSKNQNQLEESTKKSKTSTESPMGEALPISNEDAGKAAEKNKATGTLSFKQVVANEMAVDKQQIDDEIDLVSEDEEEPEDDDDKLCPVIRLTREEKVRLRSKWKQTLIVKVMGKSVGYGYLLRRLTHLWKPKARMELVTIENGYFLAKFASVDDYEFAKYGGPWMVLDHYLIVKEWIPNFDPFTERTESMIVWIRFPCLPAEYFDHKFLMRVGGKVGRPINIDTATSLVSRASFARVCVEVDITKPLLAKFTLKNRVRPIVYEGLHLICFTCGMYGHNTEGCSLNQNDESSADASKQSGSYPENPSDSANGKKGVQNGKAIQSMGTTIIRPEVIEDYGSWMIAQNPKRKYTRNQGNMNHSGNEHGKNPQQNTGKGKQNITKSGSRFESLEEPNYEIDEMQGNEPPREQAAKQTKTHGPQNSSSTKGKRSTVQVSEKQITGNNAHGLHKKQFEIGETSKKNEKNKKKPGMQANQAGASNEHTLVQGDKSGAKVTQVIDGEPVMEDDGRAREELGQEHHDDPPDSNYQSRQEDPGTEDDEELGESQDGTGDDVMEFDL